MGCGCGRGRNAMKGVGKSPAIVPKKPSLTAAPTKPSPTLMRMQSKTEDKNTNKGYNKDRKAIEKKRRDAILKRLGKI